MSARGHLLPVAALGAASVVGGVVSLVGATALGVGSTTTTVRQIQPALGGKAAELLDRRVTVHDDGLRLDACDGDRGLHAAIVASLRPAAP